MGLYAQASFVLLSSVLLFTAGCSSYPRQAINSTATQEPQPTSTAKTLGTQWGEDIHSAVQGVTASRLTEAPYDAATIYYQGEAVPKHIATQTYIAASPLELQILDENKRAMPMYRHSQKGYKLPATEGMRYTLQITNNDKNRTYEVVTTVDGLDVLNGQAGAYRNRGYLIRPGKKLTIEGFRKNSQHVAAFRFAAPESSYVNQNVQGDARNIGVIGLAFFEVQETLPACEANPFPANTQYAPAPCRKY
ncbi:hypothetical protein AB7W88_14780 [Providencia vermicola]|uniref:hypothetical protein n=1 Tax=Providencia TaxID=586 RepID=UPI0012B591B9|nr:MULTISPECIES: hypothetical protein [Providencia]ELZ5940577.1 hypothetical protein [Providencia stuartii]MCK1143206.1 hypothetical protein [Providencia stuartii]MTB38412.1 hypothetical protein [Providencia sp. wls1949]MTC07408.1 hypothetical protein [Providencia sp. wls1948]